jgi:hypothetical protein
VQCALVEYRQGAEMEPMTTRGAITVVPDFHARENRVQGRTLEGGWVVQQNRVRRETEV